MLVLVLGPTGAGKSEIIQRLCSREGMVYISPDTTRALRSGETDKRSVSKREFEARLARGEYVWVNELFGVRYGTPKEMVTSAMVSNLPVFLLDFPDSGLPLLGTISRNVMAVIVMPPSLQALVERLGACGRLSRKNEALQQYQNYTSLIGSNKFHDLIQNRVVVNDNLESAYDGVLAMIRGALERP